MYFYYKFLNEFYPEKAIKYKNQGRHSQRRYSLSTVWLGEMGGRTIKQEETVTAGRQGSVSLPGPAAFVGKCRHEAEMFQHHLL